ncbi:MAG: 16S rRNA (uracil1498-N3)-methyltransferase [Planctomycetota bacterium]|jgi:16S rRNA (uracil1498-N3)-methyltransferase
MSRLSKKQPGHSGDEDGASRRFFVQPQAVDRGADEPVTTAASPKSPQIEWRIGRSVQLLEEDAHHALHVIRLQIGDALLGLDGAGCEIPLRVTATGRSSVTAEVFGSVRFEEPPGSKASRLPHLRLAVSLPRPTRVEAMIDRLTQMGVAHITPIWSGRSPEYARSLGQAKRSRLTRTAREACKQCTRLWLPTIDDAQKLDTLNALDGPTGYLLDPGADQDLLQAMSANPSSAYQLVIGPEGGWTDAEQALLATRGFQRVRLAGHVMRIETAAELASGLVMQVPRTAQAAEAGSQSATR